MTEKLEKIAEKGKRIPIKDLDKVTCPIEKKYCEGKGHYNKCYFNNQVECSIYQGRQK